MQEVLKQSSNLLLVFLSMSAMLMIVKGFKCYDGGLTRTKVGSEEEANLLAGPGKECEMEELTTCLLIGPKGKGKNEFRRTCDTGMDHPGCYRHLHICVCEGELCNKGPEGPCGCLKN